MVNVSDAAHGSEWGIMQEPANDWINASVVELIDFRPREVRVASLPSNEVESKGGAKVE